MKKEQQFIFSAAKFEKWQRRSSQFQESDAEIDQKFKSKLKVIIVNPVVQSPKFHHHPNQEDKDCVVICLPVAVSGLDSLE